MKLSMKFTLCFLVGFGVVQAIFSYLRVQRESALFEEDFRGDHETMGRDLSAAVMRMWKLGGIEAARSFVDETNANKSQVLVRLVEPGESVSDDPENPVSAATLKELSQTDRVFFQRVNIHGSPSLRTYLPEGTTSLRTYIPVGLGNDWLGTLELTESFEKAHQYVRMSTFRTLLKDAIIIVVTGTVALVLGLALVGRPVRHLVDRARKLASGNMTDHIDLKQSDELGDLAREINAMFDQLAEAHRRVEEETNARISAIEQLRHADRLRTVGQLTSGIAHELGTPLNVVWERAKMVARDPASSPTTANSARIMTEQCARMTAIIRQLLDFSRPTQPKKVRIDFRQVIRRTLTLLQPTVDSCHVTVQTENGEEPVMVDVDVDQIQQVASNLIMNAIHAMSGGGTMTLTMGTRRLRRKFDADSQLGDFVFFTVKDTGHGIPSDDVPRVFDPFFTTKDVGQGTGLGLSISLGIVKEHGGWIDVESAPGQGARFTVFLPKEEAACLVAS